MGKRELYSLLVTSLAVLGVLFGGCTKAPQPTPTLGGVELGNPIKRVVTVEAEEEILHYQDESSWNEKQFLTILESKAEFESSQIKQFNESLSKYHLRATSYELKLNELKKSIMLKCDVHNAIFKSGNRYTAEFEWLLRELPFDLYAFEQSERKLSCEIEVSGVPTAFLLEFPALIGHCHYHVWWTM